MAAEGDVPSCLPVGCLGFLFSFGLDFSLVYVCVRARTRLCPLRNKYSESGENENGGFNNIDVPICRNTFCQVRWGAH